MFVWTMYRGKPAVYDTQARVFYTGYKTVGEARQKAADLNEGR